MRSTWNVIADLQAESKSHANFKKTYQSILDNVKRELAMASSKNAKLETEIDALKVRFLEEQEKVIAVENYSRRENLRFMKVLEQEGENVRTLFTISSKTSQTWTLRIFNSMQFMKWENGVRRMRHRKLIQGQSLPVFCAERTEIWYQKRREGCETLHNMKVCILLKTMPKLFKWREKF